MSYPQMQVQAPYASPYNPGAQTGPKPFTGPQYNQNNYQYGRTQSNYVPGQVPQAPGQH